VPVVVEWTDSYHTTGWRDAATVGVDGDNMIVSLGILVEDTPQHLRLALSHDSDRVFGHYLTIPKVAIKRWKKVHVA
jgi:hypothetical protein